MLSVGERVARARSGKSGCDLDRYSTSPVAHVLVSAYWRRSGRQRTRLQLSGTHWPKTTVCEKPWCPGERRAGAALSGPTCGTPTARSSLDPIRPAMVRSTLKRATRTYGGSCSADDRCGFGRAATYSDVENAQAPVFWADRQRAGGAGRRAQRATGRPVQPDPAQRRTPARQDSPEHPVPLLTTFDPDHRTGVRTGANEHAFASLSSAESPQTRRATT
jgi:hypothetical protein